MLTVQGKMDFCDFSNKFSDGGIDNIDIGNIDIDIYNWCLMSVRFRWSVESVHCNY